MKSNLMKRLLKFAKGFIYNDSKKGTIIIDYPQ
jgi:hypothetical protein